MIIWIMKKIEIIRTFQIIRIIRQTHTWVLAPPVAAGSPTFFTQRAEEKDDRQKNSSLTSHDLSQSDEEWEKSQFYLLKQVS